MKRILNKFSILTIALISGLIMTACTASEKASSEKGSAGEAAQSKTMNSENNSAANNFGETKKTAEKTVLYDFRKLDDDTAQNFSKAETAAVVKYLFGDQASEKIEIRNRLTGAFTKPNAKETLYYFTGCKDEASGQFTTDCPHVSWNTEGWIAIYDGTTPVLKINEALGSSIGKVTDVNGDGKNEFLSFGGYAQSGIQTMGVSIGQISGGKYENIKSFNGYAYNCAVGGDKPISELSTRVAVISYVPSTSGVMPEFTEEHFKAKCKADNGDSGSATDSIDQSSWKKITKKEFDEFFDSLS